MSRDVTREVTREVVCEVVHEVVREVGCEVGCEGVVEKWVREVWACQLLVVILPVWTRPSEPIPADEPRHSELHGKLHG